MIPLGLLGQVYVACAAIGIGFVGFTFAIGQLDECSADLVGTGGHDMGVGTGHDAGHSAEDMSGNNTSLVGHASAGHASRMPVIPGHRYNRGNRVLVLVLSFLSPMSIALNLAFFGLAGLFFGYLTPWLGLLTLVPAIAVSFAVTIVFKRMMRWMLRQMHVTSHAKSEDAVGQMAEVNTPFEDGRTGEVTYIIGSKRYSSAAKCAKTGLKFGRGDKVMIVDVNGHMVYVEPWEGLELVTGQ